jgi:hypothetical protein
VAILSLDKKSFAKHLCDMNKELAAYIGQKSTPVPECDCWIWTGCLTTGGYGHGKINGRQEGAHRISWMAYNGHIGDGLHVLHKCDVPACVNPDHLFLGTAKDNVNDMILKGRNRTKSIKDETMSVAIQQMVLAVEAELQGKGIPVVHLTTEAGIAPSTWSRWKSGSNSPTMKAWTQTLEAKARLLKRGRRND